MRRRHACALLAAALALLVVSAAALLPAAADEPRAQPPPDEAPPALLFLSWDGTPAWVLERMLDAGVLPNVERLRADGAMAAYSVGNWASKTAPGHAAVFTGAFGDVSGITGNGVPPMPAAEHAIDAWGPSGFSAASLMAEPMWVTAARQGRRVASVSATQSQPFEMYTDADYVSEQGLPSFGAYGDRLWMVDGYGARILNGPEAYDASDLEGGALRRRDEGSTAWTNLPVPGPYDELRLLIGESTLEGVLYGQGEARRLAIGLTTDVDAALAVLAASPPSGTDTAAFSAPIPIATEDEGEALVYLRLYEAPDDGSDLLLWRSYGSAIGRAMTDPADEAALVAAAGAFTGNARLLDAFGPTLPEGGDGSAERRYAETALLVNDWFRRATVWAIQEETADVVFSYSPYPDEMHHLWYGLLDPGSAAHDPELAAELWPLLEALFADLDRGLGAALDALEATGRPWNAVLFTDHGFMGVTHTFYPNRVLAEAGLLRADAMGVVDPSGTTAMYMPQNSAFVSINAVAESLAHRGFAGGIVADEGWEDAARAATEALLAARDPDTGAPIVTGVFRADEMRGLGIGGRHGGDLYLDLAPGYTFSSRSDEGPIAQERDAYGSGDHIQLPFRETLQGMAVFGGAGIEDLGEVSAIRSIDIAPTMAFAAGLEPPAQAQGHAVAELLSGRMTPPWPQIFRGFVPSAAKGEAGDGVR